MSNTTIKLKTGDIIIVRSTLPTIQHYGVVLVSEKTEILHITPSGDVRTDTIQEFLKDRKYQYIRKTAATRQMILERFELVKNAKYDLNDFNCIQFAEYLTGSID